jgi:hypothetical protein
MILSAINKAVRSLVKDDSRRCCEREGWIISKEVMKGGEDKGES